MREGKEGLIMSKSLPGKEPEMAEDTPTQKVVYWSDLSQFSSRGLSPYLVSSSKPRIINVPKTSGARSDWEDWVNYMLGELVTLSLEVKGKNVLLSTILKKWAKSREWEIGEEVKSIPSHISVDTKRLELISLALDVTNQIEANWQDLEARLDSVMKLKSILRDLWLDARHQEDTYFKHIAHMLHDALQYAYAEKLERQQIISIRTILDSAKGKMTEEDAKKAHDRLLASNLEYMPPIKS